MENIILMCAAGTALVICLTATFLAARKSVNNHPIRPTYKQTIPDVQEGEIPIDDAVKYLKLTNLY